MKEMFKRGEEIEFTVSEFNKEIVNIYMHAPIRFVGLPRMFISSGAADITVSREDFKAMLKAMLRLDEQL